MFQYYDDIMRTYHRNDFIGRISKNILEPPLTIYIYDKSIPGHSQRIQKLLPPRFSFRYFASHRFLIYFILLLCLCYLIGYNPILIPFLLIIFWSFFVIIKSLCYIRSVNNQHHSNDSYQNQTF